MVSHFKITRLPSSDIIAMIGAEPLQKDQLYPIERETELNFQRIAGLEGYYVLDNFEFQTYDQANDRYSNPAESILEWKENDLATPLISSNVTVTMQTGDIKNVLELTPVNKAVEFIEVVHTEGINNTRLKGLPIVSGDKLSPSELYRSTFEVIQGGGEPYFVLEYKLGRGNDLSEETYTISINVDTLAGLDIVDEEVPEKYMVEDEFGFSKQYAGDIIEILLSGAPSYAEVALRITANHQWVESNPTESKTDISVNGLNLSPLYFAEVFEITSQSRSDGTIPIDIFTEFPHEDHESHTGNITIEILSINGSTEGISDTKNIVIAQTNI